MADFSKAIETCKEESQRLDAEKEKDYHTIQQLLKRRRELQLARNQMEKRTNDIFAAATIHGLTECLEEVGDGSDRHNTSKAVCNAGNLIIKVTQLYENDAHLPLIDVSACLEQAIKESNFREKEFHLELNQYITDAFLRTIAPLLAHAEMLDLWGTAVTDLTLLIKLRRLRWLSLKGTPVKDFSPLAELKELKELRLDNTHIKDMTPIAELKNLKRLHLTGTSVRDLMPLSGLKELKELFLCGVPVSDITFLAGLHKMEELHLTKTQVADITALSGLQRLKELWLTGTRVRDLAPLSGLKELKELWLDDTQVHDLTPLTGLLRLQNLDLSSTPVSDFTPLIELKELISLNLHGTSCTRNNAVVKELQERRVEVMWYSFWDSVM